MLTPTLVFPLQVTDALGAPLWGDGWMLEFGPAWLYMLYLFYLWLLTLVRA